jgi:hypothetical protein
MVTDCNAEDSNREGRVGPTDLPFTLSIQDRLPRAIPVIGFELLDDPSETVSGLFVRSKADIRRISTTQQLVRGKNGVHYVAGKDCEANMSRTFGLLARHRITHMAIK